VAGLHNRSACSALRWLMLFLFLGALLRFLQKNVPALEPDRAPGIGWKALARKLRSGVSSIAEQPSVAIPRSGTRSLSCQINVRGVVGAVVLAESVIHGGRKSAGVACGLHVHSGIAISIASAGAAPRSRRIVSAT